MDEQMIVLEPCPFCGGEAESYSSPQAAFVRCENCGAEGSSSPSEAAAAWNTRAAHSVMSARVAELEEALKPFADQMTTAELLHNPDRSELTPEHRIERMGERKRERDANILRARAALAPHPKADE